MIAGSCAARRCLLKVGTRLGTCPSGRSGQPPRWPPQCTAGRMNPSRQGADQPLARRRKKPRRDLFLRCLLRLDVFAPVGRFAALFATGFADLGFDGDIGPLFQEPEEAARQAVENDVHVIGISTMAAAHGTLVPRVIDAQRKEKAGDIVVICGGVIPPRDHPELRERGVAAFFGPGTSVTGAADEVLRLIGEHRPDGEGKRG